MSDQQPTDPYPTAPYPAAQQPAYQADGTQPQQPVYGYPYAAQQPAAPAKKSKAWIWFTIGAVLLLCCVGGAIGGFMLYDAGKKIDDAALSATSTPSSGITSPTPDASPTEAAPTSTITLAAPTKLTGLPKLDTKEMRAILDPLTEQLKSEANATEVLSGAYGKNGSSQIRVFVAAKSDIGANAEVFATGMATGLKNSLGTNDMASVDAGPLGGAAQCGSAKQSGSTISACIWADEGSYGIVFFFNTKLNDAKKLFITARGQIETKA